MAVRRPPAASSEHGPNYSSRVDWIALASVVSSAVVGISGKTSDALSKRGDRKHLSKIEFDKRVWDTKSTALTALISVCLDVSDKCELRDTISSNIDPERNRKILSVLALDRAHDRLNDDGITGAVVAFSSEGVRRDLQKLLATIDREREQHRKELVEIRRSHDSVDDVMSRIAEVEIGSTEDAELWSLLKQFVQRSADAEEHIAANCDLKIDALKQTCESVISEARKDLQPS